METSSIETIIKATLNQQKCVPLFFFHPQTLTACLLSRGPHTLKDARFPHGVKLFGGVIMLVEVNVGLFPGFCHSILRGTKDIFFNYFNQSVGEMFIFKMLNISFSQQKTKI